MPDAATVGWLIANFGIAIVALILLDRSHRDSHKKIENVYQAHIEDKQVLINSLQSAVDVLKEQVIITRLRKGDEVQR